jgi:dCTP deaminase
MGLKNDKWIKEMAEKGMIRPYAPYSVKNVMLDDLNSEKLLPIISYGVSSYGYDMRVAGEFKIFTNHWPGIIDPKNFDDNVTVTELNVKEEYGAYVIIPPNSFALARSVEYFVIPRSVMTICLGKSTLARCGIIVNVTAFEPEWEGHVTIEISNTTPLPLKIYPFEGIAQVLFFEADEVCEVSYKDRKGKYQGQTGIQLPKV